MTEDWSLNPQQMLFLMQHHNISEAAYAAYDVGFLRQFTASDTFLAFFPGMGFDEAYDRYETMLGVDDNLDYQFNL